MTEICLILFNFSFHIPYKIESFTFCPQNKTILNDDLDMVALLKSFIRIDVRNLVALERIQLPNLLELWNLYEKHVLRFDHKAFKMYWSVVCMCLAFVTKFWFIWTGFGSSWKYAKVEKGSTVAIFGLGAIGMGVSPHPWFMIKLSIPWMSIIHWYTLLSSLKHCYLIKSRYLPMPRMNLSQRDMKGF